MKVIIAGSRTILDKRLVDQAVAESGFQITEVVSGGARGVDALGEQWAKANSIPCKIFLADWSSEPKAAGFIRNTKMAEYADALIAVTNGSNGTRHMIDQATKRKLTVYVKTVKENL